jgi:hypothetical protein
MTIVPPSRFNMLPPGPGDLYSSTPRGDLNYDRRDDNGVLRREVLLEVKALQINAVIEMQSGLRRSQILTCSQIC